MRLLRLGASAFACVALLGGSAQAEVMTLNEALSTAYDSNPQLGAERASLRATDEGVAQANAGWRPTINAQGSYGVEHQAAGVTSVPGFGTFGGDTNARPLQGQLTVTQPIFRGGKTYAEIGRAKALVRQGRASLLDTEQQVLLASVTAYMNVARDEATVRLEQNNVSVLQKQLDATQEQFKVGELTKTDVAQSQARLAGAQAQLTIGRGQLAASRANFEQVIGRPAETLDDQPAFPKTPKSEDEATDIASKSSPVVLSAVEAERAADYAVDDAVGSLAPQVSVQGQYQYQQFGAGGSAALLGESGTTHTTSVMGVVTVPIYQGGAEEASVRQAKELHGQTQLLVVNADRQARANAQAAWETYASAQASIESDKVQVTADTTALEGVRKEQEVGARTILDVLNAQQELLNAQVAVISAQRDAYVAAYQLLQATGELTARYLALNVKFYDETEHYDEDANKWIGFGN